MQVGNLVCVLAYASELPLGEVYLLPIFLEVFVNNGNTVLDFDIDFWLRPIGQRVLNMILV